MEFCNNNAYIFSDKIAFCLEWNTFSEIDKVLIGSARKLLNIYKSSRDSLTAPIMR
jgi:hypothetical protein